MSASDPKNVQLGSCECFLKVDTASVDTASVKRQHASVWQCLDYRIKKLESEAKSAAPAAPGVGFDYRNLYRSGPQ